MRQPFGWRILRTEVWEELVTAILENFEFAHAFAGEIQDDAFLGVTLLDRVLELLRGRHLFLVHFGDDVAGTDAVLLGHTPVLHFRDDDPVGFLHPVLIRQFLGQRLDGEAEALGILLDRSRLFVGHGRGFFRPRVRLHVYLQILATADDVEGDRAAEAFAAHGAPQLLRVGHRLSIHRDDDIGGTKLRFGGWAPLFNGSDDHAVADALGQVAVFGEIFERDNADAQPGADIFAVTDQLVADFPGHVAGNGKPDSRVETTDEGIDADDFAVDVDERAAAVAGVDVGVGLDEVLVHGLALAAADDGGATLGADVTEGDAVIEIEWRADGDGKFTHAGLAGVADLRDRQPFAFRIDLDDGDVGLRIHPAHFGIQLGAVLEADSDLID